MGQTSLIRRASRRCLNRVRRSLSRESHGQDDKSSLAQTKRNSEIRSSLSTTSLFTTTTVDEDDYRPLDESIPEETEAESPSQRQGQLRFFPRISLRFRERMSRNVGPKARKSEHSSFSSLLPGKKTVVDEGNIKPQDEPMPEAQQDEPPRYDQGQSRFFRRLPAEIREQIYQEFWVVSGVERHAFVKKGKLFYSPCIANHEAPDERQTGLARDFASSPEVQYHPEWFERMESSWCNHWRCEKLWKDIQDGVEVDHNKGPNQGFMSLLLSCKRMYDETVGSFREHKIINITNGPSLQRILKFPRPQYFTDARIINISLREDSGNWLYLNSNSLWHFMSELDIKAEKIYLWLDAECPVTRRLLPEFRDLYKDIPDGVAHRLTIDFPCDAHDGFWAWGEIELRVQTCGNLGEVKRIKQFVPNFKVVARGRPRFNQTQLGYVSSQDKGRPEVKVLRSGNPFEDIMLYGRGIHHNSYY